MSNRIIWILIIFLFFIWGYGFYQYFFVYNTVKLKISSNVEDYKIELYTKNIGQTFRFECKEKECVFKDIAPLSYQLEVIKYGYISFKKDIDIKSRVDFNLDIVLEKKISLEKIDIEDTLLKKNNINTWTNLNTKTGSISPKEKIELLKNKNKNYE